MNLLYMDTFSLRYIVCNDQEVTIFGGHTVYNSCVMVQYGTCKNVWELCDYKQFVRQRQILGTTAVRLVSNHHVKVSYKDWSN